MFRLEIKTGGAAFRSDCITDKRGNYMLDDSGYEVQRIMKEIGAKLGRGETDGVIMDSNGNKVGRWSYE